MNRVLYPNGVDLDLKRDGRGRITEIAFTRSGVYLDGEMRRLDAVGNTTTRERSGEDELRFGYDTLDQLLQVAAGMSVQEVYAYDAVGNWSVDGRRHDACVKQHFKVYHPSALQNVPPLEDCCHRFVMWLVAQMRYTISKELQTIPALL